MIKRIHWFEAKQLDRVTNYSSRLEPIRLANKLGVPFNYYCTYNRCKKYFKLENNIKYLGLGSNKVIRYISFRIQIIYKSLFLGLGNNNCIIVNQDLILDVLPALLVSKFLGKSNKFVVDIRTTPTVPETFDNDMALLHKKFKLAVKYFHGFSFITSFMQKVLLNPYSLKKNQKTVNWSSGVNMDIFDYVKTNNTKSFNKPFKVFYHGGISESRGNLLLIKACEILKDKGYNVELDFVGICVDASIKDYIKNQNISSWCNLMPPLKLEDIPPLIQSCDLPVLPFPNFLAWRVSSPIKLMEYLAMGKKVLAPKYEAFTDVFGFDEEKIFYFDPNAENQILEMTEKISNIIDSNLSEDYEPLNQINFVKDNITWEIQSKKLIDFCLSL